MTQALEALLGKRQAAVALLDGGGRVVTLSPAAERLLGPDRPLLDGQVCAGRLSEEQGCELRRANGSPITVEVLARLTDGRLLVELWEDGNLPDGGPVGGHDLLYQVTEHIREVMWLRSIEPNRMLYVSRAYEEVWERSREELYADPTAFLRSVHPDDLPRVLAAYRVQLEGGPFFDEEYRIVRPDGAVRWVWARNFPILDAEGQPVRVAGIADDVTERKELEDRLQQHAADLEARVEERTGRIRELERQRVEAEKLGATARMAARIAHEINNPLAGVKNCLRLLEGAVDPGKAEFLALAEREIDRIGRIVHQMLDLHRPEERVLDRARLSDVLASMRLLLDASARAHEVHIATDSRCEEAMEIPVGLVRQLLYNLIQNAIEASPPGSTVRVSAHEEGGTVVIEVSDEGPGIAAGLKEQIFEPFFTTKSESGGLGLGLSICKGLVEAMDGDLEVESGQRGTTFRVSFPAGRWSPSASPDRGGPSAEQRE